MAAIEKPQAELINAGCWTVGTLESSGSNNDEKMVKKKA